MKKFIEVLQKKIQEIFCIEWIKAAGLRAIKTAVQSAIGTVSSGAMLHQVDFLLLLNVAGLAGFMSLCTSLAGLPELSSEKKGKGLALAVRGAKTFVQVLLSYAVTASLFTEVAWGQALSSAVVASLVSVGQNFMQGLPEVEG